ncbi:MAG: Fur family transcriptional regulator [Methylotenera sp.]
MNSTELIFQHAGLKSTASRLEVTSILAQNNYPLTHQELLRQLSEGFDRVTLYRILDWLLQHNIIHRIAGDDRAWRFQLNANRTNNIQYSEKNTVSTTKMLAEKKPLSPHSHAHFQCSVCGKIYCLESHPTDVHPKVSSSIPAHFTVDSIELNIKGKCADCQL